MKWLLFLVVIGPQGPTIGNDGRPIAHAIDQTHCEAIGGALSTVLNLRAGTDQLAFDYRCIEGRGA